MQISLDQLKQRKDVLSIFGVTRPHFDNMTQKLLEEYGTFQHNIAGDKFDGWVKVRTTNGDLLYNIYSQELTDPEIEQ